MIRLKLTSDPKDIEKAMSQLGERVGLAMHEAGKVISEKLADEVKARIPSGGGWLDIYRDAIEFVELSQTEFGVVGVKEVSFTKLEAETTLFWFEGGDKASQALAQYNPWPIDAIPAVKGGIVCDAIVKPASKSEVSHHRQRIAGDLNGVIALLGHIGVSVEPDGLPSINGKVYADIDFMSRRLEFGLGGFPRTPHWAPAAAQAQKIAASEEVAKTVERALKTGEGSQKPTIEQ